MLNADIHVVDADQQVLACGFTTLVMVKGEGWVRDTTIACSPIRGGSPTHMDVKIPLLDITFHFPLQPKSSAVKFGETYVIKPPVDKPLITFSPTVTLT